MIPDYFIADAVSYMTDYVIMRRAHDFPLVRKGDDVDILCRDMEQCVGVLQSRFSQPLKVTRKTSTHCHVDLLLGGCLYVRFDLYEALD